MRKVALFIACLLLSAAAVVASSIGDAQNLDWGLLILLVAMSVGADWIKVDIFGRGHISAASAPIIALAILFGVLGPAVAELVIALFRAITRQTRVSRYLFDLGALTLAGAIAAVTYGVLDPAGPFQQLAAAGAAGLAYYLANSFLLGAVMGLDEGRMPLDVWRENLAWLTPQYAALGLLGGLLVQVEEKMGGYGLLGFSLPLVMFRLTHLQYVERTRKSVEQIREVNDELEERNRDLSAALEVKRELMAKMQKTYVSTIRSLARIIEARDPYTGGHTERVSLLALEIAAEFKFSAEDEAALEVGAELHDIGKVGVPDDVLLKKGPLTDAEFETMRTHPNIASYIVSDLDLPPIVIQMMRHHHERYDGKGYPDGLAGEAIPLAARILTVADSLDAMRSDRPYRKALPMDVAREELRKGAGKQFCPKVVEAFERRWLSNPDFRAMLDDIESRPSVAVGPQAGPEPGGKPEVQAQRTPVRVV